MKIGNGNDLAKGQTTARDRAIVRELGMGARSLKRDLEVNALALERQKMV